jgi:HK97 family phage portal protein
MGILQTLGLRPATAVEAQLAPAVMSNAFGYGYGAYNSGSNWGIGSIARESAIQVPAVNACRNLITGVIATLDLELYKISTGEELGKPLWLDQPDLRQPRAVTMAYTIDSLIFNNVAYWRQTEQYADDGRGSRYEWIANSRVTFTTNKLGTSIDNYFVDGSEVPMSGNGSLITFQGINATGILQAGARTIQAALDLEKAASISASTPMPTGYLKNTGADLPEAQISGLLASWKAARQSRSTAYLTSTLSYETTSFSPKDMMYNEAAQFLTTQICRLFGVPAWMLSASMDTSMTYQNILDSRKEFMAYTLQPYITAIETRLSMNDMTANGNIVKFAVDDTFLRADPLARLAVTEKLLTLGLIDINQAKEMEDLTPDGNTGATINEADGMES